MNELDDELAGTFQQCADCGTPVVNLGAHRCGATTETAKPQQQERLDAAAQDSRCETDTVLIVPYQNNGGAYAYHEMSADGTPVCGGPGTMETDEYQQTTRQQAQRRGRAPCRSCENLAE